MKEIILNSDVIIAADGGANHCAELIIKPDFIIGDLDSISSENRQKFCNSKIIQIKEQQTSDLEKALNFADTLSPSLIRIFSVFGNRSDHAFYNLQILQKFDSKTEIEFYDNLGFWKIYRAGQNNLTGEIGKTFLSFRMESSPNFIVMDLNIQ